MTETETALSERVKKCEDQIEVIRNGLNKVDKLQVEFTTKLDNVLVELGRVRESIEGFKSRPAQMWDKLIYGVIGACAATLVSLIINGGI